MRAAFPYMPIVLGVGLLVIGLLSFLPGRAIHVRLPWADYVKKQLGHFIGRPGLGTLFMAGTLNGLLPCGLVYMALSSTLSVAGAPQAAAMMYIFGLGTMPMLVSITLLKTRVAFLRSQHIRRLVPVVVFSFGCLFVLRGMNLGIPYLSPRVAVVGHEIKSCCCHKK